MKVLSVLLLLFLFAAPVAIGQTSFRTSAFHPFINLETADLVIGKENSIAGGFHAPSIKQCPSGLFEYRFSIQNLGADSTRFYYQLFYAKETHPESLFVFRDVRKRLRFQNDPSITNGFHLSEKVSGKAEVVIKNYFSINTGEDSLQLRRMADIIRRDAGWFSLISKKALENKISPEAQLYSDALYVMMSDAGKAEKKQTESNRNEAGIYRFMLVVFPENQPGDFKKAKLINASDSGRSSGGIHFPSCNNETAAGCDFFCGVSTHTLSFINPVSEEDKTTDCNKNNFVSRPVISFDKTAATDRISLQGRTFFRNGKPMFPVILNYIIGLVDDGKDIWPCASEYYMEDGDDFTKNKWSAIQVMKADFELLSSKGIRYLRITGLGETGKDEDTKEMYVHTTNIERKHIKKRLTTTKEISDYFESIRLVLDLAYAHDLKVILLVKNVVSDTTRENLMGQMAKNFSSHPGLMAYDFFNEPLYFDKKARTKNEIVKTVRKWNDVIKKNAPFHLTTIGLVGIREVFEWDPSLLPVDFVSFHPYEYEPEQVRNEIYWYGKHVKKPWIIGETAISADDKKVSYRSQKSFAEKTFRQSVNCGASGYSWWQYKDVDWKRYHTNYMGMVSLNGTTLTHYGNIISGTCKPIADIFQSFSAQKATSPCHALPNYYNYSEKALPVKYIIKGMVVDKNKKPVNGAVVMVWNKDYSDSYHTISRADGSFELKSPVVPFQWIASYSGFTTANGWFVPKSLRKVRMLTLPEIVLDNIR